MRRFNLDLSNLGLKNCILEVCKFYVRALFLKINYNNIINTFITMCCIWKVMKLIVMQRLVEVGNI